MVMNILITGALGWTAHAILQELHKFGHSLTGLDLPGVDISATVGGLFDRLVRGDVSDQDVVREAVQGCEVIVHLAVAVGVEDYKNSIIPFQTNVRGTYNIFEQARLNDAHTVILMSSAPVHLPTDFPVSATSDLVTSPHGDHLYDLTKRLQEQIGKDYATTFGLNVITLRAGHIVDGQTGLTPDGKPLDSVSYCRGGWVCRYDLARAVARAIDYDNTGYDAFHVIGDSRAHEIFGVQRTIDTLGVQFSVDFADYELIPGQTRFLKMKGTDKTDTL
jgi:nucleoside-diphosphate-sugar epimerase